MRFHPGRLVGIIMGLVILATLFLVPFGSTASSNTLYGTVSPIIFGTSAITVGGNLITIAQGYILVIAFILLLIAGFVGIFPLGTGVLGVVAMALITINPFLVAGQSPGISGYGTAFYIFWIAPIISLAASFWHGKKPKQVIQRVSPPPPPPPPTQS